MAFIKFSFLLVLLCTAALAQERFSSKSCLDASYVMKMKQNGPLFGLLKHEFEITKKTCLIHVTYKKYFPKEWLVDVCREPVHIKVTSATGVDVAKKDTNCRKPDDSKDTSNFCSQYYTMLDVIQDDGLIFADGDRDDLTSAHGQTYCSYLLLKKYLNDSVVFSRYTEVPSIFQSEQKRSPPPVAPITLPADGVEPKTQDQGPSTKKPLDPPATAP